MADSDPSTFPPTPPITSDQNINPKLSSPPYPAETSSSDPNDAFSSSDTCTSHRISTPIREDFVKSLPDSIQNHIKKIDELFEKYSGIKPDKLSTPNFELAIMKLIKDDQAALKYFKRLLPTANLIPSPSKTGQTVYIRQDCTFHDRVRAVLYDDTDTYMLWLNHFIDYQNGSQTFPEFKRNVEGYFTNRDDLWKDFDAYLAPRTHDTGPIPSGDDNVASTSSGVEKSIQDSSAGVPSDSSDKETATKRIKTSDI